MPHPQIYFKNKLLCNSKTFKSQTSAQGFTFRVILQHSDFAVDVGNLRCFQDALPNPSQHPLQIWVAVKELTPLTLQHLNDYKRSQPQLFSIVP